MGTRSRRHRKKTSWIIPVVLCFLFLIFTALAVAVDRQSFNPIAVDKASGMELAVQTEAQTVGLGGLNLSVSEKLGFKPTLYRASNYLGYLCLLVCAVMACCALLQWIRRRSLRRVDPDLFLLMGVFALFVVLYVLFEKLCLNVRPYALDGEIEASYPSTHTLFGALLMGASIVCLKDMHIKPGLKRAAVAACAVLGVLTVLCRLLSGVHWMTDIIGGLLLSAAVVYAYKALRA